MSGWLELVFILPADDVEAWSEALMDQGALSVQAEDADADSPEEQALFGEPGMLIEQTGWNRTRVCALLAPDAAPQDLLARSARQLGVPIPVSHEIRSVPDQDWVRATQAQFTPIDVGQHLRITPSWHAEDTGTPEPGRIALILDPGLAFGTGSHPTTQLCLRWIMEHLPPGASLIDYGCGSGILAIAAAKKGAGPVVGVDIDPQAVQSAEFNARNNGVSIDFRPTTEAAPEPADVVIANILSNPLKVLAPLLTSLIRPKGSLVLAGLLDRQVDEIIAAYPGVALSPFASEAGWTCLAGPLIG